MESHLPNFYYLHPNIHKCIIDEIKAFQEQLDTLNDYESIKTRLDVLQYLCISTEATNIVIQCYKQGLRCQEKLVCSLCVELLCAIAMRLNEKQLDEVVSILLDGFNNKDGTVHRKHAKSLAKLAPHLNERQLKNVLQHVMDAFDNGKVDICYDCAHTLATSALQLGVDQLDNAFQCLMDRCNAYFCNIKAESFLLKLRKGQLDRVFQFLIEGLYDEDENIRRSHAEILGRLAMKWSDRQVDDAFSYLMDGLNDGMMTALFVDHVQEHLE
ncbi:hypothetical protein RFI_05805 [Reticulomyxa filosa]|uniref:Uncharacterized protein n=1 Tax=Reticulomyxa filosa TaxID=46433 RepID=X6P189_RETFI|nr:hypothetical protein RFI_05805 [Reticulomyxa filosa]|eukprot:ETO31317.1 hypothetical protein RFI_05805 [Reticulomyxa filosa]